ncbi:DsbE family thiol:disulfide interchange protein [Moraxella haemolytica]|uniref:DsbE family thiol:disulfide interchange protein n=1 Tax=Moraxella TaxID=475 RepID=UPI002542FE4E|nr:DsbE family thiol:disulfide interchange protein [Moraxella sp. ZY171148]WII95853.1 DsbE family thiol:disulfide interchange protein [Moraxella sp. ZY171148]
MAKSNKRVFFIIPLVVFLLAMVMFYFRLGKETDIKISTSMNKPLPEFSLPLLSDTSRMMTNQDLPKTPFLLNIWGSWCPTCKVEHPFLMQLHEKGVPLVGVNYKDELSDALGYLNQYQDPFIYSVQDLDGQYAIDLGLTGAPETFVVDGAGVVYKHILGEVNQTNWTNEIQPCLMAVGDTTLSEDAKVQACS